MALYIVSTPIGNLEDISARALKVLGTADLVACEDTRHTRGLLSHFGLSVPLVRYDEHVHDRETPRLLDRLRRGDTVALVTDAGTPAVSDPGGRLVAAALEAGIAVVPVPGPSAVLAALVGSGLPMDRFCFLGFLPRRPGRMKRELKEAAGLGTIVFYESVFRLKAALRAAREVFGDVPAAVARELTKVHEEFIRGTLGNILEELEKNPRDKGEAAVVVAPQAAKKGKNQE